MQDTLDRIPKINGCGAKGIRACFPGPFGGVQVSYTCISLAREFAKYLKTTVHASAFTKGFHDRLVKTAAPSFFPHYGYKLITKVMDLDSRLASNYANTLEPDELSWLWPGNVNHRLAPIIKSRGNTTIAELINCPQETAYKLLQEAFERAGLPECHTITKSAIASENEFFSCVDYLFSPSPMAKKSLVELGFPAEKILETSFGWSPELHSHSGEPSPKNESDELNVVFVGTLNVRKGAHVLAEAWRRAKINGKLRFVGWIGEEFSGKNMQMLEGENIEIVGPVKPHEVRRYMLSSDVFAIPTVEEGGPQVTYEAASLGLGIITTEMGAGAILQGGSDGIIVDPFDVDGWANALNRFHSNRDLLRSCAQAAKERAAQFSWDKVALQRLEMLQQRGIISESFSVSS
ncbi:glycosyltransferase family 4 protein [Blastopirellula marina]|uniref:Glycosyl transferase family 1 domain-containing protein n=1 Tax=Blastopirellula marina TaxID=124 RepID=A0A2S8F9D3_9BACT|nr:glycosyltransferase family 4 protein [Blastopirellula marina]PQO28773.1 hypothetical protein C5Y98_23630 [Blastopirellula marina]PTL42046.1 hypothetical protein C5Y97_23645 [Blastopirellula marina]